MAISQGLLLPSVPFLNYKQLRFLDSCSEGSRAFRNERGCRDDPGVLLSGRAAVRRLFFILLSSSLPSLPSPLSTEEVLWAPAWGVDCPPSARQLENSIKINENQVYLLCHRSFCEKHRPTQDIQRGNVGEESCVLCCEDLSQASVENIQSPCCSQTLYHRKCIQVGLSLPRGLPQLS